jgi:16S rRNA (adenine1518-N6/adenine1519-N6)-dimethyltransferase
METLKGYIREYGGRPKKSLGQVFLIEKSIQEKIFEAAHVGPDDVVVEIGPGTGGLTRTLASRVKRLFALEIDQELVQYLHESMGAGSNTSLICIDALRFDFHRLSRSLGCKPKVIGNLPYSVSTPLLFHFIEHRHALHTLVLMLQKEVAQRLVAHPGTKAYGILTVMTQAYMDISFERYVPRHCFYPIPNVDSALIKLVPREESLLMPGEDEIFSSVVHAAFAKRRKTLYNALRASPAFAAALAQLNDLLKSLAIEPRRRGETLQLEEFISLARKVRKSIPSG